MLNVCIIFKIEYQKHVNKYLLYIMEMDIRHFLILLLFNMIFLLQQWELLIHLDDLIYILEHNKY